MLAMRASELGSTAAFETSVFQALLAGKGHGTVQGCARAQAGPAQVGISGRAAAARFQRGALYGVAVDAYPHIVVGLAQVADGAQTTCVAASKWLVWALPPSTPSSA